MKKAIFTAIFALLSATAFSQAVGEKVYKEVNINGEKLSKWLTVDSITEYDSKGNEIHFKDSDGFEYWHEYDSKGNQIHSKDSGGREDWYEYDSKGNKIHSKYSIGNEYWYEYTFWDNGKVKTKTEYKTL